MLKETSVMVLLIIVAVLLCLNIIISCSGDEKSPSQVFVAAFMAANEGKYLECEKYLSTSKIDTTLNEGEKVQALKSECEMMTRKGTIEKIETVKEDVRGERATVSMKIYFKDGYTVTISNRTLIKEDGQWKIALK